MRLALIFLSGDWSELFKMLSIPCLKGYRNSMVILIFID